MKAITMLDISFDYQGQAMHIYPAVLSQGKELTLVDCGYPGFLPRLEAAMYKQNLDPQNLITVVITHHDYDHMGALYDLKRKYPWVCVAASQEQSAYIDGRKKSLRLQQAEELLARPQQTAAEKKQGRAFCEKLQRLRPVTVEHILQSGDKMAWGGGCEVLATPGHMPGHISLYLPETNAIITGDAAVAEQGRLVLAAPEYTLEPIVAAQTLQALVTRRAAYYYCYHGGLLKGESF